MLSKMSLGCVFLGCIWLVVHCRPTTTGNPPLRRGARLLSSSDLTVDQRIGPLAYSLRHSRIYPVGSPRFEALVRAAMMASPTEIRAGLTSHAFTADIALCLKKTRSLRSSNS